MNELSIGDLAHGFMLRRQSFALKQSLTRLTSEMATGQTADLPSHLRGRYGHFAGLERELMLLGSYRTTVEEARTMASVMQTALQGIQDEASDLGTALVLAAGSDAPADLASVAGSARGHLAAVTSALNTRLAGRALFSGTEVASLPIAPPDQVLADLRLALAGSATAADVLASADTFFDAPGGGFETGLYLGGTTDLEPHAIGAGESVALGLRADDPILRDVIKTVALAALADDAALPLSDSERQALVQTLTERNVRDQDRITGIRADLGYAEARVDTASVRIGIEISAAELARSNLLSVDPFDTATELEAVQVQIETLYTITARSSRLSLVNFLT